MMKRLLIAFCLFFTSTICHATDGRIEKDEYCKVTVRSALGNSEVELSLRPNETVRDLQKKLFDEMTINYKKYDREKIRDFKFDTTEEIRLILQKKVGDMSGDITYSYGGKGMEMTMKDLNLCPQGGVLYIQRIPALKK